MWILFLIHVENEWESGKGGSQASWKTWAVILARDRVSLWFGFSTRVYVHEEVDNWKYILEREFLKLSDKLDVQT